jgi:hypothetical protein
MREACFTTGHVAVSVRPHKQRIHYLWLQVDTFTRTSAVTFSPAPSGSTNMTHKDAQTHTRTCAMTFSSAPSGSTTMSSRMLLLPRLLVIMMIEFLKLTVRPYMQQSRQTLHLRPTKPLLATAFFLKLSRRPCRIDRPVFAHQTLLPPTSPPSQTPAFSRF